MRPFIPVSHSHELDTSPDAFGELEPSNGLLGDVAALHARMDEYGYLLFRDLLDRNAVLDARRELLEKMRELGEIDGSKPLMDAFPSGLTADEKTRARIGPLWKGAAVSRLCRHGRIIEFFSDFLGGPARTFDYLWLRAMRPGGASGIHYDIVYMGRGTRNLYTSWIPVGDVPLEHGPLLLLESSNHLEELITTYGAIDVDRASDRDKPGGRGWLSTNPVEVRRQFGGRWLTADFHAGDLLVFTMHTLHCSLDNRSDRVRLSIDARYQLASDPMDERWVGENPMMHGEKAKR